MLFRGVKDKNVLKYAKVALEDASEFNRTIRSLHTDVYVCSITSLHKGIKAFILKCRLALKLKSRLIKILNTSIEFLKLSKGIDINSIIKVAL
jgi:hypothetical protein